MKVSAEVMDAINAALADGTATEGPGIASDLMSVPSVRRMVWYSARQIAPEARQDTQTEKAGTRRPGVSVDSTTDGVIPVPPSVNNLYTRGRGHGRRVISAGYRKWLDDAIPILAQIAAPERYPVKAVITITGRIRANRDIDNMAKPILDAAVKAGALRGDDCRSINEVSIVYAPHLGRPGVQVEFVEQVVL